MWEAQAPKAIVAGGSDGLGRSAILALAQKGVEVVASARGAERLHAAAADISEQTASASLPLSPNTPPSADANTCWRHARNPTMS
jgi:gluconate 5-dehydrogenase